MSDYRHQLETLGERARQVRLAQNLTQHALATRAGVGLATVQRFEKTGAVSLENALRLAMVLRVESGFDALFSEPAYSSLDEALSREPSRRRRRASRRA